MVMATPKLPRRFFKFASLDTALRVIESTSFRWSSPAKFNDPFDHQAGFTLNIHSSDFARLFTESFERLVFSDCEIPDQSDSLFTKLALELRDVRHRLPRESLLSRMRDVSLEMATELPRSIATFNREINRFLCHSRVLCVSEHHDNVVMWSHYADGHCGVVFGLNPYAEDNHPLSCARHVTYTDDFVAFPTAEEYAKHLTGEARIDVAALSWTVAFTKHRDWAYEREWRVHLPLLDEPAGDGVTLFRENPPVFEAVYLGCRMASGDQRRIVACARRHLPGARIYRARRSDTSFVLTFEEGAW